MASLTPHASLHTLYSDHHGWLHGWLRRKLGCTHQAADLAQDTFVRILDKQRELSQLREPRAYLTTIAQGLVVNHWRRRAIEQAYCEALAAMPQPLAQSPEQRHAALQALEEISRLLDQLPARTKQIFLLSQLDGMSYAQIAAHTGFSINIIQKAMIKATIRCYQVMYG